MHYDIVRYRPELRPGILALLPHLVCPDAAINDAWFAWKHERNPYVEAPVVYVALADGEVAGMRAFQGARWQIDGFGGTADWPCACDFVVAPAHRGNKLFRQIMDVALAELAAAGTTTVLNWSASPVTFGVSRRAGWRLAVPYAPWRKDTVRATLVRRFGARLRRVPLLWRAEERLAGMLLGRGFRAFDAAVSGQAGAAGDITVAREPRPEAMAALATRTAGPGVAHVRDAAYYRWRFGNPLSEYRFVFKGGDDLAAFLVLRVARRDACADLAVVDWAATDATQLQDLLARVAAAGGYDSLTAWSAAFGEGVRSHLRGLGFHSFDASRGIAGYEPGLLVHDQPGRDHAEAARHALDAAAAAGPWDLRPLYSDYY